MSSALSAGDSPLSGLPPKVLLDWAMILIFTLLSLAPIFPFVSQEYNTCQAHWHTPIVSSTQEAEAKKTKQTKNTTLKAGASLGYIVGHV